MGEEDGVQEEVLTAGEATNMNMERLKRSRKPLSEGDIFVYRMKGQPYGYGRVVRLHTRIADFEDVPLIYIHRAFSIEKLDIPRLSKRQLLLPPLGTSLRPWTSGFFEVIENRPLTAEDRLEVHCFKDPTEYRYCDEYGRTLPKRTGPCGLFALHSHITLDVQISMAIGIEPAPDTVLPPVKERPRANPRAR